MPRHTATAGADRREHSRSGLAAELASVRAATLALVERVPDEVLAVQMSPFMSPLAWDLCHVAHFEELWLLRRVDGRPSTRPELEGVLDPFETPRSKRGALRLPGRAEALARLEAVRSAAFELLERADLDVADLDVAHAPLAGGFVYRMVAQHETQHRETMMQALDLLGVRLDDAIAPPASAAGDVDDEERVTFPEGVARIGTQDRSRAYDNERPAHDVALRPFAIDKHLVTCRRWTRFIEDGGYRKRWLWSDDGWRWLEQAGTGPQGWTSRGGSVARFGHVVPIDPSEPVQHVSFHEAEALARWAGARLPTEQEWERAAAGWTAPTAPASTPFDATARLGPQPRGLEPREASASGVEDLFGQVYQWTSSTFAPYDGFEAFPYPEYSEPFFGGRHRVLRGGSWAAGPLLWRLTYRNWDLPERRQLFAGVRLAWDV